MFFVLIDSLFCFEKDQLSTGANNGGRLHIRIDKNSQLRPVRVLTLHPLY